MKKVHSKKKIILIVSLCLVLVLAIGVGVVYPCLIWDFEKCSYTATEEEIAVFLGVEKIEGPTALPIPPWAVKVKLRGFPWDKDNNEKLEESIMISKETLNASKAYNLENGLGEEFHYSVVWITPKTLKYEISGAPNGEKYVVTVDRKSDTPTVTYEKK